MNEQEAVNFLKSLPALRGYQADPVFSQWQLDPKDVIDILEHTLRGERWGLSPDGKSGAWVKTVGVKALVNEVGIQAIIQDVTSSVNRVVIMSNLAETACNEIILDKSCSFAAMLVRKFWPNNEWGMSRKDFDPVYYIVMLLFEACINRARMDGERKKLYETQKMTETHVIGQETQKRGGLLSMIPALGGGK